MPLYILDTDIESLLQRGSQPVARNISKHSPETLAITVITVEEQIAGWFSLLRRVTKPTDLASVYQRLADTVHLFGQIQILSFNEEAIGRYSTLRGLKLNVGSMDLKIAATVLVHASILVTRNRVDFGRVPGLILEDWST